MHDTPDPKGKCILEQLDGSLDNQALGDQLKVYTKKTYNIDMDKFPLQFMCEGHPTKRQDDQRTKGSSEDSLATSDSLNAYAATPA